MGMKFYGLTIMDMFVDTWIPGFQIICNITDLNKYFVGDLQLVVCPSSTYKKKHEIKCPTNKNDFTVVFVYNKKRDSLFSMYYVFLWSRKRQNIYQNKDFSTDHI